MRSRGVEIHGLLLVAALVAAWVSWTADEGPPRGEGKVTMWDLGGEEVVTAVRWEAKGRKAELERKAVDGGEPYVWGRTERERKVRPTSQPTSQPSSQPAAAAAAAKSEGEGEGEGEAPVEIDKKVFLANARAAEVLVTLAKPVGSARGHGAADCGGGGGTVQQSEVGEAADHHRSAPSIWRELDGLI